MAYLPVLLVSTGTQLVPVPILYPETGRPIICDAVPTGWPNEIPVQNCLLMTQGLGYCVLVVWYGKSTLAFLRVA